jgi:tetratricopeptide (TPR) repeat protein
LDEAEVVSRSKAHTLINKGFTLEVMGEYDRAIEALLKANLIADLRLRNIVRLNLAVNLCHVCRYAEATEMVHEVREIATEMGDEIGVLRATWLEGRIAIGLGENIRGRDFLEQALREFASRHMWFDVALALLEIAAMLLDQGQSAEVRVLSKGLVQIFESDGIHREALAALRLFWEAAEHETATADLARRVLRFLFRARYDQGLRFES